MALCARNVNPIRKGQGATKGNLTMMGSDSDLRKIPLVLVYEQMREVSQGHGRSLKEKWGVPGLRKQQSWWKDKM
jgi:hypothetical protein